VSPYPPRNPEPADPLTVAFGVGVVLFLAWLLFSGCSSAWRDTPCHLDTRDGVTCEVSRWVFQCRDHPTQPYPAAEVRVLVDGIALPLRILARDASVCLPEPITRSAP
jgi:hypothetical protein